MEETARQSGQTLLIILLVMAVGLTIGLSVISRSITDIRISQQEEESARAFSVAEAGIEQALLFGEGVYDVGIYKAHVVKAEQCAGGGREFDFGGGEFEKGDTQTVWLVEHNASGEPDSTVGSYTGNGGTKITLFWGNEDESSTEDTTPAIEATIIYEDNGYKVARYAFDPYSGRTPSNGFDRAQVGSFPAVGRTFPFKAEITSLSGTPYALRLKLFYNSNPQTLAVGGDADFPSQGEGYESTASVGEGEKKITKKVQQCKFYKAPSGIFDYLLFSGGDLAK